MALLKGKVTPPSEIISAAPRQEWNCCWLALKSGVWALADSVGFTVLDSTGVLSDNPWFTIEVIKISGDDHSLELRWTDPAREPMNWETDAADPREFMGLVTEHLMHSIVLSRKITLGSGTKVRASVRRDGEGDLFSVVVAYGPITEADQDQINMLETEVRQSAGLEI